MSEKLSEIWWVLGRNMSMGSLIGLAGFFCAVLFLFQGWKSTRREWWVRGILVVSAISFLLGSLMNDLREYWFFYQSAELVDPSVWLDHLKLSRSAKGILHCFVGASFVCGFLLHVHHWFGRKENDES